MNIVSRFKGLGYLTSTVSVILLGIVSWKSASGNAALLACLIGGMITSGIGMTFRWLSHRREQREKDSERISLAVSNTLQ